MYAIWVHSCYILQTILNNDRSQIKYWYWNITLSQNVIMNIHFTHFILPVNVQAVNPTSYELHGPFNFTYDRQHKPVFSLRSHQIIHVDTQNTTVDSGASTPLYSWGGGKLRERNKTFYHHYTQLPCNIWLSHRQIVTFLAHRDFCNYCAL